MDYPDFDFSRMNEADVREEVLAPLLRRLGYRSTTAADIAREVAVSYRLQLGRAKESDPDVRGRADYVCTTPGQVKLLIEAKPPREEIDATAVKQAWSYANHPDIAAALFLVTNGRQFCVFRGATGPSAEPLLLLSYSELAGGNHALQNLLSPAAIDRQFPRPAIDAGLPLALGLGSSAEIMGGSFTIHWGAPLPPMHFTNKIVGGSIGREGAILFVAIRQVSPYPEIQAHAERIGTDRLILISTDGMLSSDQSAPTRLFSFFSVSVSSTDVLPDVTNGGKPLSIPVDLHCDVSVQVDAWWDQTALRGAFKAAMSYAPSPIFPNGPPTVHHTGEFEIFIRATSTTAA